jgi:hypothetical protein
MGQNGQSGDFLSYEEKVLPRFSAPPHLGPTKKGEK